MSLVDDDMLDWKPSPDNNWMTTAQLLMHICISCGEPIYYIVTGEWELPEGTDLSDLTPEQMGLPEGTDLSEMKPELGGPPAEQMPAVESVAQAKQYLAEDKITALEMLAKCTEEELATKPAPMPGDPSQTILGQRLLDMVLHLGHHKAQLFYYLKLQGKPVNTGHLLGM